MSSSADAAHFLRQLTDLADRLSARGLVVSSLHSDWRTFGSWSVEVGNGTSWDDYHESLGKEQWDKAGPEVLSLSWDGRDRLLMIRSAPTEPLSSSGPWRSELERTLPDSETAIAIGEAYVVRRAAVGETG